MRKFVLFLALVLGGFAQGQNEEIVVLLQQNEMILNTIHESNFSIKEVNFELKDTLLQKDLEFRYFKYSRSDEEVISRGDLENSYNYFKYKNDEIAQVGSTPSQNYYRNGQWVFYSENYFLEVNYLKGRNVKVDTVFDASNPEIILLIDSIMYYDIDFPIKVYKKKNGKLLETYTQEQLKNKAIKEEEVLKLLKRSGVMFTVKFQD